MKNFTLSIDTYTTGFQVHASINLLHPIEPQLNRYRLHIKTGEGNNPEHIRKIIEHNASLRINFGWSFEAASTFTDVVNEAIDATAPKYNPHVGRIVSDMRCSWIGFEPHNMYDKEVYKDLSGCSLIVYNNEIIDFQIEIVKLIAEHPVYQQHAFLRDDWYRYETFKRIRKDKDLLEEHYHYYMQAVSDTSGVKSLPRELLETSIGTHFLYHPDLFFELTEFYMLKGEIYD